MYIATIHLYDQRNGALSVVFPNFPTKKEIISEFFAMRSWSAEEWQVILQKLISLQLPTQVAIDISPCGNHIIFPDTNIILTIQRAVVACQV